MVDLWHVLFEVEMVSKGSVQNWSMKVEQGKPNLACQEEFTRTPHPIAYTPEFASLNVLHAYL